MSDPEAAIKVIDAIVTDLDASDLPEHITVPYRRPRVLLPEDCPALVVWLDASESTPVTTVWFDSALTIGISWHEETVAEAQTLVNDEGKSLSLLRAVGLIKERVRSLSRSGIGVTEAWELRPAGAQYIAPEVQDGLTEGYVVAVSARLTED